MNDKYRTFRISNGSLGHAPHEEPFNSGFPMSAHNNSRHAKLSC